MKQILLKIVLFFALLGLPFLALFTGPYSDEFAYHYISNDCYNHGAWIYDRIVKNQTPVELAFIGSSHTMHAFQDKKTEELLDNPIHAVNLGYCRYGRNLEYAFLKLLLEHKSPQMVVIEVHEDEEKNSHDIFPYVADTKDLFFTPTPVNRDYFSDLFHGASARLEQFKADVVFGKIITGINPECYGYAASDRMVTTGELNDNAQAWKKRSERSEIRFIEKIQLSYPLAYLDKIIFLLNEKKIRFLFVYLPESRSLCASPKHANFYRSKGPLLVPPAEILDEPSNWMDASHLNDKGSALLTAWMAGELNRNYCSVPPN